MRTLNAIVDAGEFDQWMVGWKRLYKCVPAAQGCSCV